MKKPQWEIDNNITADRFKEHHKYYCQLAQVMGIDWPKDKDKFMGHNINYWIKLYKEDEYLNNHPLHFFDSLFSQHYLRANEKGIPWSTSNTVSCLKNTIIKKVLKETTMTTKEKLQQQIKEIESQLENFELDPDDHEEAYDMFLDEVYPEATIGCLTFSPSQILKTLDPIAYSQGLLDYIDSMDKENDPDYQELQEELEDLKEQLEDLEP